MIYGKPGIGKTIMQSNWTNKNDYNIKIEYKVDDDYSSQMTWNAEDKAEFLDTIQKSLEHLKKNDRGDIISTKKSKSKYVTDPLTDEEHPVYTEEEEDILQEIYKIEDEIAEFEEWKARTHDAKDRIRISRDIADLEEDLLHFTEELDRLRNEDKWAEGRERQKEKTRKAKEDKDKKLAKKRKEEKAIEKKHEKMLDSVPDDLQELMDDLFS
jgi:hypothetical protein